jgi:hypothetical protein
MIKCGVLAGASFARCTGCIIDLERTPSCLIKKPTTPRKSVHSGTPKGMRPALG